MYPYVMSVKRACSTLAIRYGFLPASRVKRHLGKPLHPQNSPRALRRMTSGLPQFGQMGALGSTAFGADAFGSDVFDAVVLRVDVLRGTRVVVVLARLLVGFALTVAVTIFSPNSGDTCDQKVLR